MSKSSVEFRLTDEEFWEDLWGTLKVPARVNLRGSHERCLSRAFLRLLPNGSGKKLIEIGAAPGRWLVFFHEKLDYAVDGIEYVPSASQKTQENLDACGTGGTIFQQDFFHNDLPKHSYDLVLSLGFIEHFTDLAPVITAHLALLKPGGTFVLGVPNFPGVHGAVEKFADPANLASHNLKVMNVPFMKELSKEYDLSPLWIGYVGGINPYLITIPKDKNGNRSGFAAKLRRMRASLYLFIIRSLSFIRNRILPLDYVNGSLISSYLLAVYQYDPKVYDESVGEQTH